MRRRPPQRRGGGRRLLLTADTATDGGQPREEEDDGAERGGQWEAEGGEEQTTGPRRCVPPLPSSLSVPLPFLSAVSDVDSPSAAELCALSQSRLLPVEPPQWRGGAHCPPPPVPALPTSPAECQPSPHPFAFSPLSVQRFFSHLRWTLHQNGFHRCRSLSDPTCVVYWGNAAPPPSIRRQLRHADVRVLHFPHLTELTHKLRCSRSVERQRRREGSGRRLFPAIPTSFILPDRSADWLDEHRRMGGFVHPAVQKTAEETVARPWAEGGEETEEAEAALDAESAAFYSAHSSSPPSPLTSSAPPVWILKPSHSGSGHGIVVSDLSSPSPLLLRALRQPYVAQRYVERPLLLDGRKADCRLYVALLSALAPPLVPASPHTAALYPHFPLQVFLFDDGLVRLASKAYQGRVSLDDPFVHLTNNALARQRSPHCGQAQNRHFHSLLSSLPNPTAVLRSIELCVLSAISSSSALLRAASAPETASHFALLGFDVLLDERCTPWLCEVNHLPDLQISVSPYSAVFPVDCAVKKRVIADLLTLLALPAGETGDKGEGQREDVCDEQWARGIQSGEAQSEAQYCVGGFRRLV